MPDGQDVTCDTSRWNTTPEKPRLQAKAVFMTDERTIRYAETCLGIIEYNHLGDIVGGPTAARTEM